MKKRLRVLKLVVWFILYIAIASPAIHFIKIQNGEVELFELIGYFVTLIYCWLFSYNASDKFTNWLFKGVDNK